MNNVNFLPSMPDIKNSQGFFYKIGNQALGIIKNITVVATSIICSIGAGALNGVVLVINWFKNPCNTFAAILFTILFIAIKSCCTWKTILLAVTTIALAVIFILMMELFLFMTVPLRCGNN